MDCTISTISRRTAPLRKGWSIARRRRRLRIRRRTGHRSACNTPTVRGSSPPIPAIPTASGWYNTDITEQCLATDQNYTAGQSGSGFLPLLPNSMQGSPTEEVSVSTNVGAGSFNSAAYTSTPSACDVANNCATGTAGGPFMIDEQAPAVTASAGSSSVGGSPISVTFTCSDAGSGIPSGGCTIGGTPTNYTAGACVPNSGASVTCGGTIATTGVEGGTLTATAVDNAGNQSITMVSYNVGQGTPTITFGPAPTATYPGNNFTVSATTNSNGALTYSYVSGPCSLVSATAGTFSPTGIGTCVAEASVAPSTNYLAGSATRFAARWWRSTPFDVAALAAGLAGAAASAFVAAVAVVPAGVGALAPPRLGLRGRTSRLVWTRRLIALASVLGVVEAIGVGLGAVVAGVHGACFAAACLCLLSPLALDLSLALTAPVEDRSARTFVRQARRTRWRARRATTTVPGSLVRSTSISVPPRRCSWRRWALTARARSPPCASG